MGMSNAQRQAAFRQRHLEDVEAKDRRINLVVSVQAKAQLQRLASCYGVTQRQVLQYLLAKGEEEAIQALVSRALSPDKGRIYTQYYDSKVQTKLNLVTP